EILSGMTLTGTVNVSPIAIDDAYTAVGNTLLRVGGTAGTDIERYVANGVLSNDAEFFGDTAKVTSFTQAAHGTVAFDLATGGFTYKPKDNFTGTDTFTYAVSDKGLDGIAGNADDLTSSATVTITVSNKVWYVDSAVAAGGTGTSFDPF